MFSPNGYRTAAYQSRGGMVLLSNYGLPNYIIYIVLAPNRISHYLSAVFGRRSDVTEDQPFSTETVCR